MDFEKLLKVRERNHSVGWAVADFLNQTPRAITCELMDSVLSRPCPEDLEEAVYRGLLSGFLGLEADDPYMVSGVSRLEPSAFARDPYYNNIVIPDVSFGAWRLGHQTYEPYEAFLRDDLILDGEGREIPAIGYFAGRFSYPSVFQDGREWMSIKPSEIASSAAAVAAAHGRVVTFGLGLGYFVYMALLKPSVEHVTVVELDGSVIELFEKYILPQFPRLQDVEIVQSDAFDYLDAGLDADFVFMDIWHDIADGASLYVRARQYESRYPSVEFSYWAERSLRCAVADSLFLS